MMRSAACAMSIMPDNAEQHQDVIFAAFKPHALDVAIRKSNTEQTAHKEKQVDEGGETVNDHHVAGSRYSLFQFA